MDIIKAHKAVKYIKKHKGEISMEEKKINGEKMVRVELGLNLGLDDINALLDKVKEVGLEVFSKYNEAEKEDNKNSDNKTINDLKIENARLNGELSAFKSAEKK